MADWDMSEMLMMSRWWGSANLADNEEFWRDCSVYYHEKTVVLPLCHEPAQCDMVTRLIKCPPGVCGICCHYPRVAITQAEQKELESVSCRQVRIERGSNGETFLNISGGCQFLKKNACSIYEHRPRVCRAFPILNPREAVTFDGQLIKQMQMRLKCRPAMNAIRAVLSGACRNNNWLLLPDLSLVPAYNTGGRSAAASRDPAYVSLVAAP
jgi:Fe-S-cluster containining protein